MHKLFILLFFIFLGCEKENKPSLPVNQEQMYGSGWMNAKYNWETVFNDGLYYLHVRNKEDGSKEYLAFKRQGLQIYPLTFNQLPPEVLKHIK
jgi:hypothetical protein